MWCARHILSGVVALWMAGAGAAAQTALASNEPTQAGTAAESPLAADINEEVARVDVTVRLPNGRIHTGGMIITHFRPPGPGPFPIVVFSHGRTPASRHEPMRWRALPIARYWTRRGFAVIVPTRVGYGELGQAVDPEASGACASAEFRPAVEAMATQVVRAVEFAQSLPWTDAKRVVLSGVSYGGFATLAGASKRIPGVIGAVNFVGGLGGNAQQRPGAPCQAERVTAVAASLGATSRVPTLWLYADNDRYWGAEWPRRWFDAYTAAGGNARMTSFAPVGDDGHRLMSGAFPIWRPVVDRYVASLGFSLPVAETNLPASGFATLDEIDKLPHVKSATAREGYAKFLAADLPRAFAVSRNGAWAWRSGLDAVKVALERCQGNARAACSLYAVDDRVVWNPARR